MAYFDYSQETRTSLTARIARLLETPHDRRVRARAARVAQLRALSDADLAEMGLNRDEIVLFVFKEKR